MKHPHVLVEKRGNHWVTTTPYGEVCETFELEEHARLEASVWHRFIEADLADNEDYGEASVRKELWEAIMEIMKERGMKV